MRILISALALLVAGLLATQASADTIGTYGGELRGNDILKCDDGSINLDVQFIVDGSAVGGNFNKGTLTGSIEGARIKARAVNRFPRAGSEDWWTGSGQPPVPA